ncbi:FtsX-like permease family protein [Pseudocolwellia sp. AS88]|uniref:ABC transporter permease n=1 Tax=Pseudocolwellia sp. AS88 TaxID=3063958 RepID=UPI0026EAAE10|nr:FtsX-like permease family protein [Pseudocolwellia sp. AS88]MDO7084432.1 FtsX-like permease family protein [Pseudocolwellia sp. AS88]
MSKLTSSTWFKQSIRLLHHELRKGELTIVFLAIVLAVATVFSLTGFSDQVKQALTTNSVNTLAADRVLRTSTLIPEEIKAETERYGFDFAQKVQLKSMVFSSDNMLLTDLDIVTSEYPLRGDLLISKSSDLQNPIAVKSPAVGEVWVDQGVLGRMDTAIGEQVDIGVASFTIAGVIVNIPDRSFASVFSNPTIIMNIADLDKTELIQPGSRVFYKYLFAGDNDDLIEFGEWVKPKLNESQDWVDVKSSQSRIGRTLDTAEKFLSLASMLGIVLAAIAVAVASRRYGQRHKPTVAVFKALGATNKHIQKVYVLHWSLLSVISILTGLLVGYGLLQLGAMGIEKYLSLTSSSLTLRPFTIAVVTGLICAVAFAIHPISKLIATSPIAVIKGFEEKSSSKLNVYQTIPLLALFLLLYIFSNDLVMSASLLFGGIVVSIILLFVGKFLMGLGRTAGTKAGKSMHLAFANLKRRANENSVQLVSFTLAIQLLLLITVMKSSILSEWQQQMPEGTPNHYLINITNEEVPKIADFAAENDIQTQGFFQVFRGRLSAINGEATVKVDKKSDKADEEATEGRRGVGRELSLTWQEELSPLTEVVKGQWWDIGDETPQVSVEEDIAERLAIELGDQLTFTIGSDEFTVPVTSIRDVNWQSRQLNFYMIFNKSTFSEIDSTSISAWRVAEETKPLMFDFLSQYPSISIIDIDAIMKQLTNMIDQMSIAIELILVLVVLAGSLVLVAQVQASMEERERELAILRTLGAKGSLLRNSVLFEFVALGAIAGLMASIAMEIAVFFLQTQVFDMDFSLHFEFWLIGITAGAAFVGIIGMLSCWRLLNLSSVTLIRRTM